MEDTAQPPFLAIAVVLDAGARAAAVTRSHADAYERATIAANGADISGVDLIELTINPTSFLALRKIFQLDEGTVGLYDLFPLAGHLAPELRTVAAQFLAAEALWALEEQGQLGGIPLNLKLNLPKGWKSDPKELHEGLVSAGALDLNAEAIQTYKTVKAAFDESK